MANLKNTIETIVKMNTSSAKKSSEDLFKGVKKSSKSATKEVDKVGKSVDKVGNKATVAGGKAKKGLGGIGGIFTTMKAGILSTIPALGAFKSALISTGVGAIIVALGSFVALMIKAASAGAKFGKSLSSLKGISGATADELKTLSTQAKSLGATTAFTASQVVELQTELAKLGFTAKQVGDATPSILDLAASLDVDLAEAAEFAGSVVRSFGLDTKETGRVVDVLASSAINSAQNFSSLKESFKLAAPTARALGISLEETGALLGALANNGLKGSIAGTGLSKTFIKLSAAGLTLDEGIAKVNNSSNRLATAIDLVGIIGAKTFLTLASSGDDIQYLTDKLNDAEGSAKLLAKVKLDNLAGDLTKLGSAWEGFLLGIEDGTGLMVTLARSVVQATTSFLGLFTETQKVSKGMEIARTSMYKQEAQIDSLDKAIVSGTLSEKELYAAQQDRKKIIEDLIAEYPGLLSGIDAEKVSSDDLKKSLDEVNKSLVMRIALQKKQEIIDEQGEETSDALIEKMESEATLLETTAEARKKYSDLGLEITSSDPAGVIEELTNAINKEVESSNDRNAVLKTTFKQRSDGKKLIKQLQRELNTLEKDEASYNEEFKKGTALIEDRENLKGAFKDPTEEVEKTDAEKKAEKEKEDKIEKDKKAAEDAEALKLQREKDFIKQVAKDKKEASKIDAKLQKEAEDLEAETSEQKLALARERRITEINELLISTEEKNALISETNALFDLKENELSEERKLEFAEFRKAQEVLDEEGKLERKREASLRELDDLVASTEEKRLAEAEINAFYDGLQKDRENQLLLEKGENQIIIDELDLEARRLRGENVLALEYELLEKKRIQELSAEGLTAEEILIINKKYAAANKAVADAEKDAKLDNLASVGEGLQAVSALAGENTVAGKALAVASAGIETYLSAQKAYTSQLIPGDPTSAVRATIAAGVAVAGGLANIKKIVAVKVPVPKGARSGGGGGGGGGNVSPGGNPFASTTAVSNLANNNAARLGIDPSLGNTAGAAAANNVLGGNRNNIIFSEGRYDDFKSQVSFKESKTTIGGS